LDSHDHLFATEGCCCCVAAAAASVLMELHSLLTACDHNLFIDFFLLFVSRQLGCTFHFNNTPIYRLSPSGPQTPTITKNNEYLRYLAQPNIKEVEVVKTIHSHHTNNQSSQTCIFVNVCKRERPTYTIPANDVEDDGTV